MDLYLIHHPRLAVPDIPTAWREMEEIQAQGLAKYASSSCEGSEFISHNYSVCRSIGVSNFGVDELTILLASAKVKPAANQVYTISVGILFLFKMIPQILLHPYVYVRQAPILAYAATHGIVIEAYSSLM